MRPLRRDLRNPVYLASRVYMRADARFRPDRPWFGGAVIRFLDRYLSVDLGGRGEAWEWGSGRSTPWFAQRVRRLVSVESDPAWHARVAARLVRLGLTNADLRLVAGLDPTNFEGSAPPAYVDAIDAEPDASLDLVLVDGDLRLRCVARAQAKLRPGGLLVVDNTTWTSDWGVPASWPVVHRSANYLSETTAWRRPQPA